MVRREFFITLLYAKIKDTSKYEFAMCQKKAHGKQPLCCVPDRKHTTNYWAHNKELDSDSASPKLYIVIMNT